VSVRILSVVLGLTLTLAPHTARAAPPPEVPGDGGYAHAGGRPTESAPSDALTYPVKGIDVSSHDHSQHPIDWPAVAGSGVRFAYIKATEGSTYTNPYFAADYAAAKSAGLWVGAYAFGRPDLGNPVGQADYLVQQSQWTPDPATLVPFLDIEWPYGALHLGRCYNLTPTQMVTWIRAFVEEVAHKIGRRPMIYTNTNWWNPCTGNDSSFGEYPLDIAGYTATAPRLPAGWNTFAVWQYAAGSNAIAGNYDKDVYNGDEHALQALAGPSAPAPVSLRASVNHRLVSADNAGKSPLIANRTQVGPWEEFDVIDVGGGYVALRSHADNRYVTAENAGASPLIANRLQVGQWEKFQIVPNTDGTVGLRAAANGKYVTAEKSGTQPLIANRTAIGWWERFNLVNP
jgi:GH25 family lysozyme M1 (1,4-beta-N-acetylmuramidase)